MQENSYQIAEIYTSLRQQVLELDGEKIEEIKDKSVWAVLMETGYSDAAVTLVGVADGTASLYFSNGGGIIGAGEHEEVRRISLGFVEMSEEYLAEMTKVNKFPIPANGMTTFYILTPKDIFTYKANEEDLGEGRVKISDLFHKGHELIGQMRIAEQTKQKEASE